MVAGKPDGPTKMAVENGTKQWYIRLTETAQNHLILLDFLSGGHIPPLRHNMPVACSF
jgi:hypothetical protein